MSSVLLGLTGLRIGGGIANVSRCVARVLDEEVRAGRLARTDRVLLFEPAADPSPLPARGDQLLSRGSQPRFVWQLWRTFRRHRQTLVLFDLVGLARSVLLPLPGFPPPRYVIYVHGRELDVARSGARARALAGAALVLANSDFTAARVRREFPHLAERVRAVPLCVDPERAALWQAPEGWQAPQGSPLPPREPAALIVGRMWAEERGKGHDALLEAWPAVRLRVPSAELWIAGTGDDLPRLAEKARALGVAPAVRFLGRVSDQELGALYRRASLFAMPSRQEGFGLVYAEAMLSGLPCLGSTADAAVELIRDGETGLLVPWGDVEAIAAATASLLADPDRARGMGEEARRQAGERFSYDRFRRDLLAALELAP